MWFFLKKKTNKNRKECSIHNCNMSLASTLTMIMITQNSICIFPQYVSVSFQYFNRGKKKEIPLVTAGFLTALQPLCGDVGGAGGGSGIRAADLIYS